MFNVEMTMRGAAIFATLLISRIVVADDELGHAVQNALPKFKANSSSVEFVTLSEAKIKNDLEAKHAALEWHLKHNGLLAEEQLEVVGLYPSGRRVSDFAKSGKWIWEVRITELNQLSGVILINAKNGAITGAVPK